MFRYHNIEFILNMPSEQGIELINKAIEKQAEEKAWQMWLTKYPSMDKKNFISFSDFYQNKNTQISQRPTEEILAEAAEIHRKLGG